MEEHIQDSAEQMKSLLYSSSTVTSSRLMIQGQGQGLIGPISFSGDQLIEQPVLTVEPTWLYPSLAQLDAWDELYKKPFLGYFQREVESSDNFRSISEQMFFLKNKHERNEGSLNSDVSLNGEVSNPRFLGETDRMKPKSMWMRWPSASIRMFPL